MSKLIRKMLSAAGGPLRTTPAMSTKNVTNAANKLGEWFLQGLGVVGKFITAPITLSVPTTATTAATTYQTKKLIDRKRLIDLQSEELLGKAMTWISPLNYGAALYNGHGLNAHKGEQEVAQWSPFWQAVGRGTELYLGPKAVRGVKRVPAIVDKGLAKAGNTSAKGRVVARELNKNIQNSELLIPLRYITKNYTTNDKGNVSTVSYQLIDPIFGQPLGNAVISGRLINNGKGRPVGWIESLNKAKGVSEDIYNTAVLDALLLGELGIESGWDLMEPNKTLAVTKKFPHEVIGESEGHPVRLLTGVTNKQKPLTIDFSNHILFLNDNIKFNLATGQFEEIKPIIDGNKLSLKFFERGPAKISEAERAGVPKVERNFTPRWHVASYPGYQLKGLMKGSPLERLLSKNGTININLLNAYFNKASQIEKEVANKVLTEKFAGLKTIDYNLFKKAVLDELINYSTKPQMKYSTYGMDRLGFNVVKEPDGAGGILEYLPGVRTNTFTFESPRILQGSDKHYDYGTLGHSRTYTTPEEPKILHVMESLSDWSQEGIAKTNEAYRQKLINNPESYNKRITSLLRMNEELLDWENTVRTGINHAGIKLQPYEIQQIQQEFIPKLQKNILNLKSKLEGNPLALHLSNNYLQRQLQENLRYAAENGLTKMRYPTPETAAKIEGYTRLSPSWELIEVLEKKYNRPEGYVDLGARENFDFESLPEKEALELSEKFKTYEKWDESQLAKDFWKEFNNIGDYYPQHLTILKKYADFPKLFLKLFKGHLVEIVTDPKGNTWYLVNVPKRYLNREWLFKDGGKMNGDSK